MTKGFIFNPQMFGRFMTNFMLAKFFLRNDSCIIDKKFKNRSKFIFNFISCLCKYNIKLIFNSFQIN